MGCSQFKANMNTNMKMIVLGAPLVVASIISIAISSWQFQSDTSDANVNESFCTDYPAILFVPFEITFDDLSFYCGYSVANTTFRLFTAILTFFMGLLLIENPFANPKVLYWLLFPVVVFWCCAATADAAALIAAIPGCKELIDGSGAKCESDIYGLTMAIDILLGIMALVVWLVCCDDPKAEQQQQAVPTHEMTAPQSKLEIGVRGLTKAEGHVHSAAHARNG